MHDFDLSCRDNSLASVVARVERSETRGRSRRTPSIPACRYAPSGLRSLGLNPRPEEGALASVSKDGPRLMLRDAALLMVRCQPSSFETRSFWTAPQDEGWLSNHARLLSMSGR